MSIPVTDRVAARAARDAGRFDCALVHYRAALAGDGSAADLWCEFGWVLLRRERFAEAVEAYGEAIALRPDLIEAHCNLGVALHRLGRPQEAMAATLAAVRLDPTLPQPHLNLGSFLSEQGLLEVATLSLAQALTLRRDSAVLNNLGNVLADQGRLEEAEAAYREALALAPGNRATHSNLLRLLNYRPSLRPETLFAEHCAWAALHDTGDRAALPPAAPPHHAGPLRIGLVSADFRGHSCGFFIRALLEGRDPTRLHVTCYAEPAPADAMTAILRARADGWRDLAGIDDAAAADLIAADHIDVLIDLSGHTQGNRLTLFMRRPAPVQVAWLGYPNTTAVAAIGWRITDAEADPPGAADRLHTERLLRLPTGFLAYRPADEAPPPVVHPPRETPDQIVFGSFNNLPKITDAVIALWGQLLRAVPGAKLLLKCRSLRDAATAQRLRGRFAGWGVTPERLELIGWLPDRADHLGLYQRIDIALDPFPYNGTTTTCEALWQGVPVVTLAGDRHAGCVGVSLLTRVGLADLIAPTPDAYVAIAAALAADGERRAILRATLRPRMAASPLCDRAGFAAAFTAALEQAVAAQRGAVSREDTIPL
ncbi:MAG: tetratricopeptide repeat protein [Azospirillaceae bacterium]|nr:tetratricopeptide repeat protein [Azospirillaceae bacterium]